jgi:hypothetical protein
MKKQALRAIAMLISIIVFAYVTAIASNAQSRGRELRADIPFDFVVGDKTLAAGKYSVDQFPTGPGNGILVRSRNGGHSAVRLTDLLESNAPKEKTTLTFHRYGNMYFLAQVWIAGSKEGRELIMSKAERSADRELAQNSRPEIVTIIAAVE